MHLPPNLLRIKNVVNSQVLQSKLTELKNVTLEFFANLKKRVAWKSPKVITTLSLAVILAGGTGYYLATTVSAAAVTVNGQQIGFVQSAKAGEELTETILQQQGQPYGLTAKTHDQITYKRTRLNPNVYQESVLSEEKLSESLVYYFDGYAIEVADSLIAVLPSKEDVDAVLQAYQDYYVKPSEENQVESVSFEENILVAEREVAPDLMKQPDQALQILIDGEITTKDYPVQANDSWWLIARKNDMLTDEVLASNPGATKETTIQPGQVIKLVNSSPYLTVVSKGIFTGAEAIPYDVITKNDTNLNANQTKIITPGSNGSKIVTYSYEQKNGIQVSKQVLDEKIVQAPVDQVVAKGSSQRTTMVASAISRGDGGSSSIVSRALSLQGSPYSYGGTGSGGYDCSGFTKSVYASFGVSIPRTSYDQFASGTSVGKSDLQPGDLVFFSTYSSGASHVGIYTGNGRFVHASTPGTGVITSSMGDSFYSSRYLGARRY